MHLSRFSEYLYENYIYILYLFNYLLMYHALSNTRNSNNTDSKT